MKFKNSIYIYVDDDGMWPDSNLEQGMFGLPYETIPCYNTGWDIFLLLDIVDKFLGSFCYES